MDELLPYIREAVDRKQENMRRRRRRDVLRLQLVKVLEQMAAHRTFGVSSCVIERDTMSLHPTFVEYIEGARLYLETETEKDNSSIREVKTHFCNFIRVMIKSFSCRYFGQCEVDPGLMLDVCLSCSGELHYAADARSEAQSLQAVRHMGRTVCQTIRQHRQ